MRATTSILLALASASAAVAQVAGIPTCAQPCLTKGFGNCGGLDAKCICESKGLISDLACCVGKVCDDNDQKTVITFAHSICDPYKVDLPKAATCAASAGSSSTATSSSGSSTAAASATTDSSSMASTGSSSAASGSMTATGSTTQASGSMSASGSAAGSSSSPAAAAIHTMGLGMVVAGVIAAL